MKPVAERRLPIREVRQENNKASTVKGEQIYGGAGYHRNACVRMHARRQGVQVICAAARPRRLVVKVRQLKLLCTVSIINSSVISCIQDAAVTLCSERR